MSSCTDSTGQRPIRWFRRAVTPKRWSRFTREIALILVVKTLLLIVIVHAVAPVPSPKPSIARGIDRHLLGEAAAPAAAGDSGGR